MGGDCQGWLCLVLGCRRFIIESCLLVMIHAMNRNNPVPLWAVFGIGVVLVGGIYVLARRVVAPPRASVIVRQRSVTPRPSDSATASASITSNMAVAMPTTSSTQNSSTRPYVTAPSSNRAHDVSSSVASVEGSWKVYKNDKFGFRFNYPSIWMDAQRDVSITEYFYAPPEVDVLDIEQINASGTLDVIAQADIETNQCLNDTNKSYDHIIKSNESGTLFVLNCSAMSETYQYLFNTLHGQVLQLSYHDDFEEYWPEGRKLATFEKIIRTLTIY